MARGVNKAIILGNACADPEVRYLPNGNAVANLSIATSDQWKDKQTGAKQERTEFHRVVFFGRIAEVVGEYVRKGSKMYIEGRLQTREWDKDGVKRYTTEIVVDIGGQMQLLDGKPQEQGAARPAQQAPRQQAPQQQPARTAAQQQAAPDYDSFDDDIPFANPYRGAFALIV